MRLAALTKGVGVPGADFAGRIAEIHAQACLFFVADGTWVTLLTAELGSWPNGITVDAPRGFSFRQMLSEGAEVAARGAVLRIAHSALAIDLRRARPWRCCLDGLRLDLGNAATMRAWRAALSALCKDGRASGLLKAAGAAIDELAGAGNRLDAEAACRAMSRLIGVGEGRTPEGDDYLVGYLAGLRARVGGIDAKKAFLSRLGSRLKELSVQTNHVSRVYLQAASDGQIQERLYTVAACIAEGCESADLGDAVASALAVGHSSGACGLLGLLRGSAVPGDGAEQQSPR